MVWDLRGALLKKQEVETARLDDFEFRLRARTMRLLAVELAIDPDILVTQIAERDDAAILAGFGAGANEAYRRVRAVAERQLIAERGDPSPHRLA